MSANTLSRKHLYTDLRPYVCTFEECDVKLFGDRHVWFEHELEYHRLEWCCRFCSYQPFKAEGGLRAHMLARHPNFASPIQLPALLQASRQTVDRIPASACILCDWEAVLRRTNTDTPINEVLVVTLEQFRRHLGSHMEQLALFALPRSYKDEDENANSNEAAAVAHSDSQSKDSGMDTAMSWKSISDHDATKDSNIPDLEPETTGKNTTEPVFTNPSATVDQISYPWSRRPLVSKDPQHQGTFPRYGPASNQVSSKEGHLYFHGGLVDGTTVHGEMGIIENTTGSEIYFSMLPTDARRPGARVGHAALLVGNAFVIFGGDTKNEESDELDNTLYLLNISRRFLSFAEL